MLAKDRGVAPRNGDGRRIDAVLFDCDGVLVDSERVAAECIIEFAARFGARFELDEALERFTGARMADNLRDIEERGRAGCPTISKTSCDPTWRCNSKLGSVRLMAQRRSSRLSTCRTAWFRTARARRWRSPCV